MNRMGSIVALLAGLLSVAACAADSDAPVETEQRASMRSLVVPGPMPFPLCAASTGTPQIADVASAAWFAGNVYTHLVELAPALEGSGFGKPGDAQAWLDEFQTLKATRKSRSDEMAAVLEERLVGRPHFDRDLEFMSTGIAITNADGNMVFEKGSTQATWAKVRDRNLVVVGFRGTEKDESPDLQTNLDVFKTGAPTGGEVHRGMSRAIDVLAPRVFERIRNEPPGTRFVLTGHSLGGALAVLFATRLLTTMPEVPVEAIYTFGAPRVGNQPFVDGLWRVGRERNIAMLFVERDRDVITRLPPTDWGYRNLEPFAALDAQGLDVEVKRESGRSLSAHEIDGYAALLKSAVLSKSVRPGGRFASIAVDTMLGCR